jgi:hypothetical protein
LATPPWSLQFPRSRCAISIDFTRHRNGCLSRRGQSEKNSCKNGLRVNELSSSYQAQSMHHMCTSEVIIYDKADRTHGYQVSRNPGGKRAEPVNMDAGAVFDKVGSFASGHVSVHRTETVRTLYPVDCLPAFNTRFSGR